MYRQNQDSLPQYLREQIPPTIEQITHYPIRNRHNYVTIPRRLSIYSKSTIPSSIDLWNRLDVNVRNSNTLNEFKSRLKILIQAQLFRNIILPVTDFLISTTQELEMLAATLTFILPTYFTYTSYQLGSVWTPLYFPFVRTEKKCITKDLCLLNALLATYT